MRPSSLAPLLLALAPVVHAAQSAAAAPVAAALPPCVQPVRFVAGWFDYPPQEFDKSTADHARLGAGAVAGKGATALGLVTVDNALAVKPEAACRGLRVELRFVKPVLRVARELPEGTCAHAHVLRHERTHVRIYREMARQFAALAYPFPASATPEKVLRYAQQQLAKLQESQRLFDSPEEYAGNLTACGGEIPKLLAAARK
jgi:hypothetical protein